MGFGSFVVSLVALEQVQRGLELVSFAAREQVRLASEDRGVFETREIGELDWAEFMKEMGQRASIHDEVGMMGPPVCFAVQQLKGELAVEDGKMLAILGFEAPGQSAS